MEATKSDSVQRRIQYLFDKMSTDQVTVIYRVLTELRTEFVPHPRRLSAFIQAGGLKHLVTHLQKPEKKIVDVSLSVLGHCVMEQEPRVVVRKEGGLPVLMQVLKNFIEEPSVRSRAARVLGSLAHDKRNASKLVDDLSVHHVLGRLLDFPEADEETLCMSIRAIHHLCDTKEHVAILGKNYILAKLSILLNKTENVNVLKKILTALSHVFSFIKRFPESCAHYWVGSEGGGKVISRLVNLREHDAQVIATKAPQILHQLVHGGQYVRPLLASKEAFEALIPVVKQEKEEGLCGSTVYMTCLLLLCRENPRGFAVAGGIPLLLDLIRNSDPYADPPNPDPLSPQRRRLLNAEHPSLFSTLLAFKYDPTGLNELAEGGLVDILVDKIVRHTSMYRERTVIRQESKEGVQQSSQGATASPRKVSRRQYRTTSPSYQAVEMEYDQLFRRRSSFNGGASEPLNIFGWHPDLSGKSPSNIAGSSPSSSFSPRSSPSWSDEEMSSGSDFSIGTSMSPMSSYPASPCASYSSLSPVHSPGSPTTDRISPLRPPAFPSSSDFEESDGEGSEFEDQTSCYSPATFAVESEPSNCSPPPRKRFKTEKDRLCCETDIKMLWLKLGQAGGKDFYENWPEFPSSSSPSSSSSGDKAETDDLPESRKNGSTDDSGFQHIAIYLLLKLSWLDEIPAEMTTRSAFRAVIDHLVETPRPIFRACQILFRLASRPSLFVRLLETHFPLEVYLGLLNKSRAVSDRHCCPLHSSLRRVGEQILDMMSTLASQFGRGEMENILIRRTANQSEAAVALAAPLVLKSRRLLRRYATDLCVLDTIFDQLTGINSKAEKTEQQLKESRVYATASLSALATFLKMDDLGHPGPMRASLADVFQQGEACRVADVEEDVFFQVCSYSSPEKKSEEHGSEVSNLVGGVKAMLQEATFFQAMFRGGFQEATAERVILGGIPAPLLKVILHIAYGCGYQCPCIRSLEPMIRTDWVNTSVILLESLDRFLLLEHVDAISSFLAHGQDWAAQPDMFASLWSTLCRQSDGFPYCSKLFSHLQIYPFLSGNGRADLAARVRVVETLLDRMVPAEQEVIAKWRHMFQARLDQS